MLTAVRNIVLFNVSYSMFGSRCRGFNVMAEQSDYKCISPLPAITEEIVSLRSRLFPIFATAHSVQNSQIQLLVSVPGSMKCIILGVGLTP